MDEGNLLSPAATKMGASEESTDSVNEDEVGIVGEGFQEVLK